MSTVPTFRNRISGFFPAAVLLAGLAVPAAHADVVSFTFEGSVRSVGDPNGKLPGDIVVGTPLSGTISYETSGLADTAPGDPANGYYWFQGPTANGFSMSVNLGSHVLSKAPSPALPDSVYVSYGSSHEVAYTANYALFDGAQPPGSINDWYASIVLFDSSATALTSDALPLTTLSLASFSDPYFIFLSNNGTDNYAVYGDITTLTPVPEPATGVLVGIGTLACLLLRRRAPVS